ncbi:MAG: DUF1559 domain-containing protein [Abitibacteriaceae bacterium]|nr:DUF1559 domain-containing protein [Abditibacteriaceae bacterium]
MNRDRYLQITENVYIDRWRGQPPVQSLKPSFSWVEAVVVLIILGVLAAILMPVFSRERENAYQSSCQSNLKQTGLGLMQYTQDYDDKFPLAEADDEASIMVGGQATYGWADAIQPYLLTPALYHCPTKLANQHEADPDQPGTFVVNPVSSGYTDYWLNRNLCGVPTGQLLQPAHTFMAGDGNTDYDATNARYSLPALPITWRNNHTSPAWRHFDCADYLFTDGHVKALRAEVVTENSYNQEAFSLKGLAKSRF